MYGTAGSSSRARDRRSLRARAQHVLPTGCTCSARHRDRCSSTQRGVLAVGCGSDSRHSGSAGPRLSHLSFTGSLRGPRLHEHIVRQRGM